MKYVQRKRKQAAEERPAPTVISQRRISPPPLFTLSYLLSVQTNLVVEMPNISLNRVLKSSTLVQRMYEREWMKSDSNGN